MQLVNDSNCIAFLEYGGHNCRLAAPIIFVVMYKYQTPFLIIENEKTVTISSEDI
jgi:hypothetical protein